MRHLGINGGWRALARSCLRNAYKTSDVGCIHNEVFSIICGLADEDENEVIVELKYAEKMQRLYGDKWYRRIEK